MVQKISISLKDWVLLTVVGNTDNVSARIEELLIKGHIYEHDHPKQKGLNNHGIGSDTAGLLCSLGNLPDFLGKHLYLRDDVEGISEGG